MQNPSPQEQKTQISDLLKAERMENGQTWYLLPAQWYKRWKDYVQWKDFDEEEDEEDQRDRPAGQEKTIPEPIDNSNLIQSAGTTPDSQNNNSSSNESSKIIKLRAGLQEGEDYELVSKPMWTLFVRWYGGGPAIPRKTIEEGLAKKLRVEVYPLTLYVSQTKDNGLADPSTEIEIQISKKATVKEFRDIVCQEMEIDSSKVRVWNMYTSSIKRLEDDSETLEDCTLVDGQKMLFEVQNSDGSWPRGTDNKSKKGEKDKDEKGSPKIDKPKNKRSFLNFFGFGRGANNGDGDSNNSNNGSNNGGNSSGEESNNSPGHLPRGLCGFNNLGNTCFMNSALQCLSNTPLLTEYFLSGKYKGEINRNNPLGMKGKIAEEYGALMKQTWNGQNSSVAPRNFKLTIGKFAPQFSGYSQHDSQELLAFLLDGLHEDLNRVIKKPYIEAKEAEGRPDNDVAIESWQNHLRRNQSIIVDLFQGQLKSTLVCPKCSHISKTWDPFMYLSLPLPIEKDRIVEVILVRYTEFWTTPVKYAIKIDKNAKIGDLKRTLSEKCNVLFDRLLLADVYNNRIYAFLSESKPVSGIRSNDVTVAYEVPPGVDVTSDDYMRVQVVNRREKKRSEGFGGGYSPFELFGVPFLFFFVKDKTPMKQIYHTMFKRTRAFLGKDFELPSPTISSPDKDKDKENGKKDKKDKKDKDKDKDKDKEKEKEKESMEISAGNPPNSNNNSTSTSTFTSGDGELSDTNIYPFKIAVVSTTGSSCGKCSSVSCNGCELKYQDKVIALKNSGHTISLDWDSKTLKKHFDRDTAELIKVHESVEEGKQVKKATITLEDCLHLFTTNERLGANDPWYCPKCKDFQQAMKKFDLWKLPQVLVVHLKRFQYSKWSRDKLNTVVEFPLEGLDLSQFVQGPDSESPIYDLFAVSNHSGGLGGGHYTAYAKNRFDGRWYAFNDSSCSPASESHIVSSAAYVLLYQRRGTFQYTNDNNSSDEGGNNNNNNNNGKGSKSMEMEDDEEVEEEDM